LSVVITIEERTFLQIIRDALHGKVHFNMEYAKSISADAVLSMSKDHAVLASLYEVLKEMPMTEPQKAMLERESRQMALQSYRLFFYTRYLVNLLEGKGIDVIVLKGASTANFYPYPELRKSGDIDLLVPQSTNMERLAKILEKVGFQKHSTQHSTHHVEFVIDGGIIVEVHTTITEEFAYKKINKSMN